MKDLEFSGIPAHIVASFLFVEMAYNPNQPIEKAMLLEEIKKSKGLEWFGYFLTTTNHIFKS